MNTDTGARQELASAPAVLSERHPACSDPVKLRMTRTIGTRAMRPLARWVLGIVVTGMLLGPEAVRADGSLQIPVAGDASLNGMVWTERRDNGFVWSGSFPFTFHALADVNGDGFADLIYTVPANPLSPYPSGTSAPNVYVQYSNGASFGPPVVVATDSSATVRVCSSTCTNYLAQASVNAVGDVNGDGLPDILFADGTVALGNGSGFNPKVSWGGDTSLNGMVWTERRDNGFVWSGSFPFTFHALADVNGDGFADLIYTVPANPLSPYPSGTSAPNVYVQYSNGASFGPPVVVATDSSATVRVCSSTCTNYLAQASVNAVGDVNGDHHPDILFADGSVANLSNPFTVFPKYFIGSVIYIPPGQGSSVTYGAGTVTGSTVSTTDSWKFSASVDTSLTFGGNGGSITFGGDFGGQTMHSVDMQNTLNQSALYKGSPPDLINHDFDFIQIFLGVQVNAAADYLHNVSWGPDFSHIAAQNFAEQGYYINVGCLRSSTTIPASVCTAQVNFLSSVGIIPADYPSILGADPFADPNASPTPDPNRYVLIDSVGYLAEGTPIVNTYNESNSSTVTNSQTTSYSYTLSASFSSKVDPFAVKESNTFTWSHSSTNSNKTGSTSTSAFALASPSATYSGPTVLKVYIDTIYKTFMFSFN